MQKRAILNLLLVVGLISGATTVRAADLETADAVVAKYIEAIGGRKAIDAVRTRRRTGKNSMTNGMEIPIVMEFKKPDKVRVEVTMQNMTGIQAFDGKIGWYVMPFSGSSEPVKMPPEQVEQLKSQADLGGPLVDYDDKGHELELVGKEETDGTEAYKLKLKRKDGGVEYHFLDAEHFLPIKITGKQDYQGTAMEYEKIPSDYKKVGDLLLAHSIKQQMVGMPMSATLTFEKIEHNVDLPDERFEMPKPKTNQSEKSKETQDKSGR